MDCITPVIEHMAITVNRREATEFLLSDPPAGSSIRKSGPRSCLRLRDRSILLNIPRDRSIFLKEGKYL